MSTEEKIENPKTKWGAAKAPMDCTPDTSGIYLNAAMACGAYKYGRFNYRDSKVEVSTYEGAIKRHLALYLDGEDIDPVDAGPGQPPGSGLPHLAAVMACCAILMDTAEQGTLVDDRNKTGKVRAVLDRAAVAFAEYKEAQDKFKATTERLAKVPAEPAPIWHLHLTSGIPVPGYEAVEVQLCSGEYLRDVADALFWGLKPDAQGGIIRWRSLES